MAHWLTSALIRSWHLTGHLRGAIKKFCNSVWCTNGRDKTITLFSNVISLYINALLTFVKKFFYSRRIEFPGHVVGKRLHGLLQLIIIEKPHSTKVRAALEVEIARSRWVSCRVRAVRLRRRHFADAAPPIVTDRRAAADRMSASLRRRFRDVITSCCTPAICCSRFL